MMQGDEYLIPFEISTENGIADDKAFEDVEIFIGRLRKTFKSNQITYDKELKAFMFPLTQSESLGLSKGLQNVQIRVKTINGNVIGVQLNGINVQEAMSRVVL